MFALVEFIQERKANGTEQWAVVSIGCVQGGGTIPLDVAVEVKSRVSWGREQLDGVIKRVSRNKPLLVSMLNMDEAGGKRKMKANPRFLSEDDDDDDVAPPPKKKMTKKLTASQISLSETDRLKEFVMKKHNERKIKSIPAYSENSMSGDEKEQTSTQVKQPSIRPRPHKSLRMEVRKLQETVQELLLSNNEMVKRLDHLIKNREEVLDVQPFTQEMDLPVRYTSTPASSSPPAEETKLSRELSQSSPGGLSTGNEGDMAFGGGYYLSPHRFAMIRRHKVSRFVGEVLAAVLVREEMARTSLTGQLSRTKIPTQILHPDLLKSLIDLTMSQTFPGDPSPPTESGIRKAIATKLSNENKRIREETAVVGPS